jgi:hypothetical protein
LKKQSTGTLDTPMKKYDLMNQINARGTYLWFVNLKKFIAIFKSYENY